MSRITVVCENCGKEKTMWKSELRSETYFCSRKCKSAYEKKEKWEIDPYLYSPPKFFRGETEVSREIFYAKKSI